MNLPFDLPGLHLSIYLKLRKRCNFGTKNSRRAWQEVTEFCQILKNFDNGCLGDGFSEWESSLVEFVDFDGIMYIHV